MKKRSYIDVKSHFFIPEIQRDLVTPKQQQYQLNRREKNQLFLLRKKV